MGRRKLDGSISSGLREEKGASVGNVEEMREEGARNPGKNKIK